MERAVLNEVGIYDGVEAGLVVRYGGVGVVVGALQEVIDAVVHVVVHVVVNPARSESAAKSPIQMSWD